VIIGCISIVLLLVSAYSRADGLRLEAGLLLSGGLPFGLGQSEAIAGLGACARVSFEFSDWSIGIASRGLLSSTAPVRLKVDEFDLEGDLSRRFISLGFVLRRFLTFEPIKGKFYFEGGIFGVQNDLINAQGVFALGHTGSGERVFFRGYGITLGSGYRFAGSPLFLQLNYEYQRFEWLQIVGTRNLLNYVVTERQLDSTLLAHRIFITVGFSEIF